MIRTAAAALGFAFVAHSPALSVLLLPSVATSVAGLTVFVTRRLVTRRKARP